MGILSLNVDSFARIEKNNESDSRIKNLVSRNGFSSQSFNSLFLQVRNF